MNVASAALRRSATLPDERLRHCIQRLPVDEPAVRNNSYRLAQRGQSLKWVRGQQHDVGPPPRGQRAILVGKAQEHGRGDRGGIKGLSGA